MSDDLIRRSDAIKATWQEPTYTDPLNVLTEVRDRIEAIQSADRPQDREQFGKTEQLGKERVMIRYDHYTDKFVKVSDRECPWCKAVCASTDKYCHECGWHIADAPQTETQTETQNSNLTFEKQTDCPWK